MNAYSQTARAVLARIARLRLDAAPLPAEHA
jgi:hypothetical protein